MKQLFPNAALAALLSLGAMLQATPAAAQTAPGLKFTEAAAPYQWDNVVIGGGGWMVALAVHPQIPDLLWLGSDVSGPWKREPGRECWRAQAWNQWTPRNLSGILGLALDPREGSTVYVERGDHEVGGRQGLYVTRDGGQTWTLALNKFSWSNAGPARKWGPSIAVDPNQPDVVYWGTFRDGVWRSLDAGKTWQQVLPPPALAAGQKLDALDPGVRCVAIDPRQKIDGRSAIVYASVDGKNPPAKPPADKPPEALLPDTVRGVYRSTDGGNSFTQLREFNALPGNPKAIRHMACGTDGTLFVSHEAGLARLDADGWKNVTPPPASAFEQGALAVNPANPQEVLCIARSKPKGQGKYYHQSLFRSRDGGATWNWISNDDGQIVVGEALPWNKKMPVPSSGSGLVFDPLHPGRVYMLDAFMVYRTDDIWAEKPVFNAQWQGVENTVVLTLCTPPAAQDGSAPVLLSGLSDIRGFRHADIQQPPSVYVQPGTGASVDWTTYVTGYDYCEGNPAVIMCAKHDERMGPGKVLLSTDGGQQWRQVTDPIGRNYGGAKLAVSARWTGSTDTLKAVIAPGNGQLPHYTRDGGKTWVVCKAADGSALKTFSFLPHAYSFAQYVAADRVDGDTFYLYRFSGAFWVSRDGGATWHETDIKKRNAVIWDSKSPPTIQAAPGRAGEVWAALAGFGILRSRDFGETWAALPGLVQSNKNTDWKNPDDGRPCLVTFGAPAPGRPANEPTVFVFARLPGDATHSLLRSSDIAAEHLADMTWTRIQKWDFGGILPNMMQGSRQVFGQLFMSGSEHGIICGQPPK
jgi:photosystem II stability/assembly factor-like uncharacterized protein